jgi:pyruvate dehydrogenase E2 component (dihydrolipoamide acetyltransferase)
MGRVIDRPWVVAGQVVARPVMQLSFSFDHRVIDGALGSRALQSVAAFLQDPALALMMDDAG